MNSTRLSLRPIHPGRPFDLAVFEDRLWISDQEHQQLRGVHKRTGKKLQRIHGNMVQPASIVVVHPLAKPGTDRRQGFNSEVQTEGSNMTSLAHYSYYWLLVITDDYILQLLIVIFLPHESVLFVVKESTLTICVTDILSFCIFRRRRLPSPEWRLCSGVWEQTGIRPLLLSVPLHPVSWW